MTYSEIEEKSELRRMKKLSELSDVNKRWLKKVRRLVPCFCYETRKKDPVFQTNTKYDLNCALDAVFVLSNPSSTNEEKDLFFNQLNSQAQTWVLQSLEDGDAVFTRPQLKLANQDNMPSPVTVLKGFALALDNQLFQSLNPDILTLAVLNESQRWRGIWPPSLTHKVQYAVEQKLSKEFSLIKKDMTTDQMATYIQTKWLMPIIEQSKYHPDDVIKVKTVCRAAEQAGVPIDKTYMWHMQDMARRNRDVPMEMMLRTQTERHAHLREKQSYSISHWIREYRLRRKQH